MKRPVYVLALSAFLSAVLVPVELLLIKSLVDRIQGWTEGLSVRPILWTAGGLGLFMVVNHIVLGVPVPMAMTRLNEIGTLEEQRLIVGKTSKLPLAALESPPIKDMRDRALRVSIFDLFHSGVQVVEGILYSAILIAILLAFGQWIPAAAVIAASVLQSIVSGKAAGTLERLSRSQSSGRRLLRHYAELMTQRAASKEIRLFGLGPLLSQRWADLVDRHSRETWKENRSAELRKLGPELLSALVGGLLLALLVLLPGADKLTAGDFTLLFMALTLLLSRLNGLSGQWVSLRTQAMRWDDFQSYLELEEDGHSHGGPSVEPKNGSRPLGGIQLHVRGLSFRYPGASSHTLSDISFGIPAGGRVAVVGENGSGKSTLIKLLTGLYKPERGEIVWQDGSAGKLADEPPDQAVSAVFQDFTRLSLTLRENVALGRLEKMEDDSALRSALNATGSKLASGLDIQLGAPFGGIEPSGGEWQKIATARAIVRDAGIIFYDEPTAALDPQAEKSAFELFLRVTEGRSSLLVTHRLGAAKLADVIVVLKDGTVTEQGTHDELMRLGGEYSRMFRLQSSWYV